MNLGKLRRVVRRHRYMRDGPAYAAFLQHIDGWRDVWKATQGEVTAWWNRRQSSKISLSVTGGGSLRVEAALEECVIEVDGVELRVPPFECGTPTAQPAGPVSITYDAGVREAFLVPEVLGHLGCGHLLPAPAGARPDVAASDLAEILTALCRSSATRCRYDEHDIEKLKRIIADAHHRRGLPALRIWPLPHRSRRPYRVCVSPRHDVDRAIVNLPAINELEARHGVRSTAYLRPMGYFYGKKDIARYCATDLAAEVALHGEFVTTSRTRFPDEFAAARGEKAALQLVTKREVPGVSIHGGEFASNSTRRTRDAIEGAGFLYETLDSDAYHHPLHLVTGQTVRRTLTIGRQWSDIGTELAPGFGETLLRALVERFHLAAAVGGIFVPVFHPIYFDLRNYFRRPSNLLRIATVTPTLLMRIAFGRSDKADLDTG